MPCSRIATWTVLQKGSALPLPETRRAQTRSQHRSQRVFIWQVEPAGEHDLGSYTLCLNASVADKWQ